MFFEITTFAAICLCTSAAPARPQSPRASSYPSSYEGTPFKFPLPNGFPNIQVPSPALTAIEEQAHGTLPNGPLPSSIADATALTLRIVQSAEIFETAYFTSLITNITNNVPGYEIGSEALGSEAARDIILEALIAVQAQEELHAIGISTILSAAGRTPVQPCEYVFQVNDFDSAIALASAFTDAAILGALQDALLTFATDGDSAIVPLFASILGQEGEQNGFYRNLEAKIPSQLPFLTRSTGLFAFSFINQNFVVPGSCPNPPNVPIFGKLNILSNMASSSTIVNNIEPRTQTLDFSFIGNGTQSTSGLSLVYINQQNLPIVESLQHVRTSDNSVTFSAQFPYDKFEMNGLTIAVVTNSKGPFTSADAVANATVFGPAIIEID